MASLELFTDKDIERLEKVRDIPKEIKEEERKLTNKLKLDCLILPCNIELEKAIKRKRIWIKTTEFNNTDLMRRYFDKQED